MKRALNQKVVWIRRKKTAGANVCVKTDTD